MNIEDLRQLAFEKMGRIKAHIEREPGHIYYHGLRTAKLAINLRRLVMKDDSSFDDVIYVGALFHDIGKGIEPHADIGAAIIKELLKSEVHPDDLASVAEIVRLHCKRMTPNEYPQWVKVVQDADILDHMGTTEIWLNFLYSAHEGRSIDRSIEWYSSEECKRTMRQLRSLLNYDISKDIWDEKVRFVDDFIKRLEFEAEGGLVIDFNRGKVECLKIKGY